MEENNVNMNEAIEETTPVTEATETEVYEDNYDFEADSTEETTDDESGMNPKAVLAIGGGVLALSGLGIAVGVKKLKERAAKKNEAHKEEEAAKASGKKTKIKAVRDQKLPLISRLTGYTYKSAEPAPTAVTEENPEEDQAQ